MLVMALQGCKSSLQKSRPLESGHSRGAVWIAISCAIKMNLSFCVNYAGFCRDSQIYTLYLFLKEYSTNKGTLGGMDWKTNLQID